MYKIKKTGAMWQVLCNNNIVQFSSLIANCRRWVTYVGESQEDRENDTAKIKK
jgi:hypothetical protein